MRYFLLLLLCLSPRAIAQTGSGAGITQFVHSGAIANVTDALGLPVTFSGLSSIASNQGTKGTIAQSWYVQPCDGTNCQSFLGTGEGKVSVTQALPTGANTIGNTGRTWTLLNTTDSVNSVQSGTWNVTNVSGTVSLPTGASTSALQTSGNSSLTSIDGKTPALGQALAASSVPVVLTAAQMTTLTPLATVAVTQATGTNLHAVVDSVTASALPSGASTSALQTSGNASLTSIDTKFPAKGQTTMSASTPVTIASDQSAFLTKAPVSVNGSGAAAASTVSTVITLTAPGNAVGFVLQNMDTSTANVRWAIGRTATTTLGQQLQPGRDSGFVPCGANVSLVAESGTQTYDIQWISQ